MRAQLFQPVILSCAKNLVKMKHQKMPKTFNKYQILHFVQYDKKVVHSLK